MDLCNLDNFDLLDWSSRLLDQSSRLARLLDQIFIINNFTQFNKLRGRYTPKGQNRISKI